MKFVGIVAEYNPFHNGHRLQIAQLRQNGAQTVAVCLSAGAVQRGSLPLLPESVRVRAALENGADLVIALPAPYAASTAETFAAAGVRLLSALGCDTLAFGAETPEEALLMQAAVLLQSADWQVRLRTHLDEGKTFAEARAMAADSLYPGTGALLAQPNNILAVEYCKAILIQNSPMQPFPLPRLGAAHGGTETGEWQGTPIASASRLRAMVKADGIAALRPFVPESAFALYEQAASEGQLLSEEKTSVAALSRLRWMSEGDFAQIRGMREGLEHRLRAAVRTAADLPALYETIQTRRYPRARLRRLVLDSVLGYCEGEIPPLPTAIHVLGARRQALPLLKQATLPASTSLADLMKQSPETEQIGLLHSAAVDFSALCREKSQPMGKAFTDKPIIL